MSFFPLSLFRFIFLWLHPFFPFTVSFSQSFSSCLHLFLLAPIFFFPILLLPSLPISSFLCLSPSSFRAIQYDTYCHTQTFAVFGWDTCFKSQAHFSPRWATGLVIILWSEWDCNYFWNVVRNDPFFCWGENKLLRSCLKLTSQGCSTKYLMKCLKFFKFFLFLLWKRERIMKWSLRCLVPCRRISLYWRYSAFVPVLIVCFLLDVLSGIMSSFSVAH